MKKFIEVMENAHIHITKKRVTCVDNSGNEIFHLVLSVSNRKIGKITNFSLKAGLTCSEEAKNTCWKSCYDEASAKMYPTVYAARMSNTYACQNFLPIVQIALDMYLTKYSPEKVRVHVGGDFFDVDYFETWAILAETHPNTQFLAYTKQYDVIRQAFAKGITVPDNMCLYVSLWTGITFPVDLMKVLPTATLFTDDCHKDTSATICPGSCANCHHCYTGKPVIFIPHGNGISKARHEQLENAAKAIFKTYNG